MNKINWEIVNRAKAYVSKVYGVDKKDLTLKSYIPRHGNYHIVVGDFYCKFNGVKIVDSYNDVERHPDYYKALKAL